MLLVSRRVCELHNKHLFKEELKARSLTPGFVQFFFSQIEHYKLKHNSRDETPNSDKTNKALMSGETRLTASLLQRFNTLSLKPETCVEANVASALSRQWKYSFLFNVQADIILHMFRFHV